LQVEDLNSETMNSGVLASKTRGQQMAKIRFAVGSASEAAIWIRYLPNSRLFCFAIVDRKLEGTLGGEASLWDFNLRRRARSTAEVEARARGLID
jgi:hypothetical protein